MPEDKIKLTTEQEKQLKKLFDEKAEWMPINQKQIEYLQNEHTTRTLQELEEEIEEIIPHHEYCDNIDCSTNRSCLNEMVEDRFAKKVLAIIKAKRREK